MPSITKLNLISSFYHKKNLYALESRQVAVCWSSTVADSEADANANADFDAYSMNVDQSTIVVRDKGRCHVVYSVYAACHIGPCKAANAYTLCGINASFVSPFI